MYDIVGYYITENMLFKEEWHCKSVCKFILHNADYLFAPDFY